MHQGGARGDSVGVPPQRAERRGGLPHAQAVSHPLEPRPPAQARAGGQARRPRDAGQGLPHALRPRRGRRRRGTDRLARLEPRPAGGPRGARRVGRGQARRGPGGVGCPKSTRPRLFDEQGEVPRRAGGAVKNFSQIGSRGSGPAAPWPSASPVRPSVVPSSSISSSLVMSRYLLFPHSFSAMYFSLAVTSMRAELQSGKVPTTLVRLRTSRFIRSIPLLVRMRRQCSDRKPVCV